MSSAVESVRCLVAEDLGVEYLRYENGKYRYVEAFTPSGKIFNITSPEIKLTEMGKTIVLAIISIALENQSKIEPYTCQIKLRLNKNRIEHKLPGDKSNWFTSAKVASNAIIRYISNQLDQEANI
ncbi:hypothetical protein [Vibrio harveyi]|uniref:hypothetical protein n=1 Tax=Vibrio harveyi TaxID=669 RepID=UPI001263B373|nr:hypothetical protein [Vibrio harveyi]QFQ77520.1 hypothetical protein F9277_08940 [Vibrio harveyi]